MKKGFTHIALLPLLCLSIALPWLNQWLGFLKNPNLENRQYQSFPAFKTSAPDSFALEFNGYISDHFGFRTPLMQQYGKLNLHIFKKSPLPQTVYFGKEGWMFYTYNELGSWDGSSKFSAAELDTFRQKFRYRLDYYKQQNIQYYMVVIPCKQTIYGDKQPEDLVALKKVPNRTDILLQHLRSTLPDLKIIDTREAIKAARIKQAPRQVFCKTDNHWNPMGAWYAHEAIVQGLKKYGVNVKTHKEQEYKLDSILNYSGNLAQFTGLTGTASETRYILSARYQRGIERLDNYDCIVPQFGNSWEYQYRFKNRDSSLAKVLFVRDSYGTDMIDDLAESTGESLFIFDAWQYGINKQWVNIFKPQVVVLMIVENHLENIIYTTPNPGG